MIPKPKILVGEVKEFIDVMKIIDIDDELYTDVGYDKFKTCECFYQQPFEPEMVFVYFDFGVSAVWQFDWQLWKIKLNNKTTSIITVIKLMEGKTLSQFITNCIQAGIIFNWRSNKKPEAGV